MAGIDRNMLLLARRQFCLDIGMDWEQYKKEPDRKSYIQKMTYASGTRFSAAEGARRYVTGDSFFTAIICMGQLFLGVDEAIYDWACEKFENCQPEWFCGFANLRMIDRKLQEHGRYIGDTHVYYLPAEDMVYAVRQRKEIAGQDRDAAGQSGVCATERLVWFEQQELLRFKENNRFDSAICFSPTQPDMLAVAALKASAADLPDKGDNSCETEAVAKNQCEMQDMAGMAGVSADGEYLWQIGINVDEKYQGRGLAGYLVRKLAEEVLRRGKVPFYGTSESHSVSQTVAYKSGFLPAFTEIYVQGRLREEGTYGDQ